MALKLSKEFKVGLFSLLSGVVFYMGFNFLKGSNMLSNSYRVHAVFKDVQGLTISSPVVVNGLNVGRVAELTLAGIQSDRVVATFEIDNKQVRLTKGTTCILASTDLLGGKAIRLNVGPASAPLLAEEDTLPAYVEKGITEELGAKIAPVMTNLDSISGEVKVLLRSFRGTAKALEGTMTSFKGAAETTNGILAENKTSIATITANAAKLSANLSVTQAELNKMLTKYGSFGDSLNKMKLATTVANLNKSLEGLNGVLKDVNAGKGSLGKLTKNDSLYTNLNHSSEALDALLKDMKARPGRYIHFSVFGKKDKP